MKYDLRNILSMIICIMLFSCLAYASQAQDDYLEYRNSIESLWKGPESRPVVALTFDDGPSDEGPNPDNNVKLLDILDRYGVKATFFVVGKQAEVQPDIVLRMCESGHEIGNHTYSHVSADKMPKGQALADIQKCNDVVYKITGEYPKYFRPPGGGYNSNLSVGINKMGLKKTFWSLNPADYITIDSVIENVDEYKAISKELAAEIIKRASNGEIILLHYGSEPTVLALPLIIDGLRKKGYGFATLSELCI